MCVRQRERERERRYHVQLYFTIVCKFEREKKPFQAFLFPKVKEINMLKLEGIFPETKWL